MKYPVIFSGLVFAAIGLTGCVGGTTYGTGVSHEQQTFEGMLNMFSFGNKKQGNIDYSARADLVVPSDKETLREPVSVESSTSNPEWPETPEQRIAKVRAGVTEADVRSGEIPLEEMLRKKNGIGNSRSGGGGGSQSRSSGLDGDDTIAVMFSNQSKEIKKKRQQLSYSKGPTRKFLTEPPESYRDPANSALAGDQGLDQGEIDKAQKQEEAYIKDLTR